jgi:DNA mismatch endonuclease (patch repair protein)
MADVVDRKTRSRMMSGIRGKNTKPELVIRRGLFQRGLRYRLHVSNLPGKPDLVFPKYRAVVFVHGCFWHGHDCKLFKWPASNVDFWRNKIEKNMERDNNSIEALQKAGWRVLVIWECVTRKHNAAEVNLLLDRIKIWILGQADFNNN